MVRQVKTDLAMQLTSSQVSTKLPAMIVGAHATNALFPEGSPPWKIEINPVRIGKWIESERLIDCLAIVGSGHNPDFVDPGRLLYLVPADTRLGALARFACIG